MEGFDQTDGFVNGAADREVVDGNLPQGSLGVDDEESTESNSLLLEQDTVVSRDLHVPVGDKREMELRAESALLAGLGGPGKVGELGVGGDAEDSGVELLKLG